MNGKPLVVVLFLAALALVAWFAFGGGGDTTPEPTGGAGVGAPAATGAAERVDLAANAAAGASASPVERTAAPTADGAVGGGVTLATVRGRLVDANKAPRAGVPVALDTWKNPEGIEMTFGARLGGERDPKDPTTTTAADGRFQFPLAADRAGILDVPGDELVLAELPPNVSGRKGDQDLGDIVAVPCARLGGIVQDERGAPVAGVKVSASLDGLAFGMSSSTTTDAAGKFTVGKLRSGTWALRTASGSFLPTVEEFTVGVGERRADLVLVVKPGQAISGQVVDDRGLPVAGLKVGSKRKEARGGLDIERFTPDEAAVTDRGGYFTLAGLQGETATVRAFGPGHSAAIARDVPVGTGNLVLRVERLAVVEGLLTGTDGAPLAGSQVVAVPDDGRAGGGRQVEFTFDEVDGLPLGGGRATAKTAADGTFRIEGVRPGTVAVRAEGDAHRPARVGGVQVLPAGHVKGVRLIADAGASARVLVEDEQGKPVAGATVRVDPPSPQGFEPGGNFVRARRVAVESEDGAVVIAGEMLGSAVTDAQGIATVRGLPAGNVELRAEHPEFAKAGPVPVALPKVGTVEAKLALRTPGFADVRTFGVDGEIAAGCQFRIEGPGAAGPEEGGRLNTSDDKGFAHVGPLEPGEYTAVLVRVAGGTRIGGAVFVMGGADGGAIAASQQRFTVVAGQTANVELRRPQLTKLFGAVTGVDGPAAGCEIALEAEGGGVPGVPDLSGLGGGRSVTAAADGTYAIDDVEPGRYMLRFGKPGQIVKASLPVEVAGAREQRQDLVLRTGKVRVQAWSQVLGQPIAGATVELQEATTEAAPRRQTRMMMVSIGSTDGGDESTTMTMGGPTARTGADGWAEIDGVPAGAYDVRIEHGKHVPAVQKGVAVAEQKTTDCGRVEMGQAGRIRGTVVGADGKPVRMAIVRWHVVGGPDDQEPKSAMGGNFLCDGLAPGRYTLRAQELSFGDGGPGAFGPEVEVDVKPGETTPCELKTPAK